jgi:cation transport regulator ChaC
MPAGDVLYFAYGSNMGPSALRRERCPRAVQVGIAKIDDHRLGFTRYSKRRRGGVADLVPARGSVVWGSVFDLTDDGFEALDRAEGVALGAYARSIWQLTRGDGSVVSAWTYVVVNKRPEILPSQMYWRLLVEGAGEAGLPTEYVKSLETIHRAP